MMVADSTAGIRAAIAAARLLTVVVAREASSLLEKHALPVAGRAVLERLAAGPATVPHMAHNFLMTRQAVQRVVTDLAGQGLVEVRANPLHRRSSLIHLSLAGAEVLHAVKTRSRRSSPG